MPNTQIKRALFSTKTLRQKEAQRRNIYRNNIEQVMFNTQQSIHNTQIKKPPFFNEGLNAVGEGFEPSRGS